MQTNKIDLRRIRGDRPVSPSKDLSSAVTFADGVRPLAVGSAELKGGLRWAHKPTGDARCHLILCLRAGRADVKKRTLEWTAAQAGLHRRMTFKAAHTHEHQLIPMSIDLQSVNSLPGQRLTCICHPPHRLHYLNHSRCTVECLRHNQVQHRSDVKRARQLPTEGL